MYLSSPTGARSILSTIAGSMITVAGVIFSITLVALTLTSSQFGPRILSNFMGDRINQFVLGTFTSTFLYCILILRSVRGSDSYSFTPQISVNVALLLAIMAILVLTFFVHHVASLIQAQNIIERVSHEQLESLNKLFPEHVGEGAELPDEAGPRFDESTDNCQTLLADESGYLQVIDSEGIMKSAVNNELQVRLLVRPGNYISKGSKIALVRSSNGGNPGQQVQKLCKAFILGPRRTYVQDAEHGFTQLSEIALRALSPGINDPYTAISCIDRQADAIILLANRKAPSAVRKDEKGSIRVIARPFPYAEAVRAAFSDIRHYGLNHVQVTYRMMEALRRCIDVCSSEERRAPLLNEARCIINAASRQWQIKEDLDGLKERVPHNLL